MNKRRHRLKIFIRLAWENVWNRRCRSALLVFSIALLVFLLTFALSFTVSVKSGLKRASDRLGADLIIVPTGARASAEAFLLESGDPFFYMDRSVLERIRAVDGIEDLTYQTYLSTIVGVCCDIAQTRVVAFDQKTDFIIKPWLQKAIGRPLRRGEAIAGYETAKNLGLELLDVEKTIFNNKFKVVGVLEQTGTGLDNGLFMVDEDLREIIRTGTTRLRENQVSIIFAKTDKRFQPYEVGKKVEHNILEVSTVARTDMGREMLRTLRDINMIFLLSLLITSFLGVSLVWAIFSAITNERRREIGILRAIGATASDVFWLFNTEVFLIGLIGSMIGISTGTYASSAIAGHFILIREIAMSLTAAHKAGIALAGFALGISMCLAGAFIPVYRITKREPLDAIQEV